VPDRIVPRAAAHRRWRRLAATALGALTVTLALTSPVGAASAPSGFFGVGAWSYPTASQLQSMSAAGLRLVRGALAWGQVQTSASPASRNWDYPDSLAREAASDGVNIIFDLNGCAVWACGTVNAPPTGAQLSAYESFVAAMVARYEPSSSFWNGQPHVPQISWQVWNEVNGGYFWPDPTPAAYATFLGEISSTIHSVDPSATVVMSGLVALPGVSGGMDLQPFLEGLYRQPGFPSDTDAIVVHGYAPNPAATLHILDEARAVMIEHHDTARPMWVTEMSWSTGGPPYPATVSTTTQNQYLTQAWSAMLACRRRWNLQHVLWYALQDVSAAVYGPPDGWFYHDGLLNEDGSAKPAYATFLRFLGAGPVPGSVDRCTLPGDLSIDVADPHTTILTAPRYTNNTRTQIVTFVAREAGRAVAGMTYECSLDGAPWMSCTSPFNAASARPGDHALRVRGIDPEGNVDPQPASATWLVDLTPPDTVITGHSPLTGTARRLRITFVGADAGGIRGFQCRLDSRRWRWCRSPYETARLEPGVHTIAVVAIDRAGNRDPSPAVARFRILGRKRSTG
jgi:hypothetical protein